MESESWEPGFLSDLCLDHYLDIWLDICLDLGFYGRHEVIYAMRARNLKSPSDLSEESTSSFEEGLDPPPRQKKSDVLGMDTELHMTVSLQWISPFIDITPRSTLSR